MKEIKIEFTPIQDLFGEDEVTLSGLMKKLERKYGEGMYLLWYKDNSESKEFKKVLEVSKINTGFLMTLGGEFLFDFTRDFELGNLELKGICKLIDKK